MAYFANKLVFNKTIKEKIINNQAALKERNSPSIGSQLADVMPMQNRSF